MVFFGISPHRTLSVFLLEMIFSHEGLFHKVLLFLRGFGRRFSGEYFYLVTLLAECVVSVLFCLWFLSIFADLLPKSLRKKFPLCQVSVFWDLVLSVLGFFVVVVVVRVFSVCLLLLLLLLLLFLLSVFLREKAQVVTGHTYTLSFPSWCCFLFGCCFAPWPLCRFCSHLFRRASSFFWRFVGGVFLASVRFWDSLGTRALLRFRASDPVSWTLGGGVFGVSPSVVFVFPLFFVFAASHLFLEWPGVVSLTRRVVLPTPWEE